jgi:anti-sigma factor RsiW
MRSTRGSPSHWRTGLIVAAAGSGGQPPRHAKWLGIAAAAAASLIIGIGLGWYGRDFNLQRDGTPTTFARQVALTHVLYASDANRPVEIWAAEERRLVNWLSKRLGFSVRAPDLNSLGFALVGGRLVAGNEMPTAMFVYENADKQLMTLQVRKQAHTGETAFRYAVEDGVGVYYWIEDNCGTHCRAISIARNCSPSAGWCTASSHRWRRWQVTHRDRSTGNSSGRGCSEHGDSAPLPMKPAIPGSS